MEELVQAGLIQGVLDITTTEVADRVVGGILPCGPHRFEAIIDAKIPFVLSLGALDMVNFGAVDTVPEKFRDRRLHVHNAFVTLMRTTPDENRCCARWIAEKLNRASGHFRILIPEIGISALDAPGQPFHDPEADATLFDELESAVTPGPDRLIRRLPLHINDPEFAQGADRRVLVSKPRTCQGGNRNGRITHKHHGAVSEKGCHRPADYRRRGRAPASAPSAKRPAAST